MPKGYIVFVCPSVCPDVIPPVNPFYEGESIKIQPNLFVGEIDLFFFDVIAL